MAQACEALGLPIVSGNVSLYNDTDGRSIHPTPVVGCVGLVPDVRKIPGSWRPGDAILLASTGTPALPGSELQARYGTVSGMPPALDLAAEAALVRFVAEAAPRCSLVHDVSDGGLAVALAEAALYSGCGARLDLPLDPVGLFGEGRGQVILAVPADQVEVDPLGSDVGLRRIGEVGGEAMLGVGLAACGPPGKGLPSDVRSPVSGRSSVTWRGSRIRALRPPASWACAQSRREAG